MPESTWEYEITNNNNIYKNCSLNCSLMNCSFNEICSLNSDLLIKEFIQKVLC